MKKLICGLSAILALTATAVPTFAADTSTAKKIFIKTGLEKLTQAQKVNVPMNINLDEIIKSTGLTKEQLFEGGQKITMEFSSVVGDEEGRKIEIEKFLKNGKITKEQADELLSGTKDVIYKVMGEAPKFLDEEARKAEIEKLVEAGKITKEQADEMIAGIKNIEIKIKEMAPIVLNEEARKAELEKLVEAGKLTREQADEIIANTGKFLFRFDETSGFTGGFMGGSFTVEDRKAELDKLVEVGKITKEQADEMLKDFQAMLDARKTAIDKLVEEGKITKEQADEMLKAPKAINIRRSAPPMFDEETRKAQLDKLIQEGKITKEQADNFSEVYRIMLENFKPELPADLVATTVTFAASDVPTTVSNAPYYISIQKQEDLK